jgi:hypothetical protein
MASQKKAKTSSALKKASAKRVVAVEEESTFDLTPVETIRLSPKEAKSLEALRLFAKAYEKL